MKRRHLLPLLAALPALPLMTEATEAPAHLVVYKSPSCGCCAAWVDYLREEGFTAEVVEMNDVTPIKRRHRLPLRLGSCHTALIDGYVVEGHVPARDIRRLIAEKPDILGISAPGMPQQSPGMYSRLPKDYDVISYAADGRMEVFSRY